MNDDASVNGSVTEPVPSDPQKPLSGGDDQVGYGKPPKEYKFRKGQSGNPKGRPKKTKKTPMEEFGDMISEEVEVRSNGSPHRMSRNELFVRRLFEDVIKGKQRAIKPWLKLAGQAGLLKPPPNPFPTSGVLRINVPAHPQYGQSLLMGRKNDDHK